MISPSAQEPPQGSAENPLVFSAGQDFGDRNDIEAFSTQGPDGGEIATLVGEEAQHSPLLRHYTSSLLQSDAPFYLECLRRVALRFH